MKLTGSQKQMIRTGYKIQGNLVELLAQHYGVSVSTIYRVLRQRR